MTVPPIGAATTASALICSRVLDRGDVRVALAQDAQAVAHRGERDLGGAEIGLGGFEIGLGLLPILQRSGLGVEQVVLALLVDGRQPRAARAPC